RSIGSGGSDFRSARRGRFQGAAPTTAPPRPRPRQTVWLRTGWRRTNGAPRARSPARTARSWRLASTSPPCPAGHELSDAIRVLRRPRRGRSSEAFLHFGLEPRDAPRALVSGL